ncbi:LacI family DNA-binding transcriptional regulator [Candidatus Epulonipiscium viviparus]|uniref:LacI family DNA-binding transcriptional regulator n=1 Tax=Candidatus Epulonipiscium viviparus TaxID=420336 RepID=UPI00016BFF49|nr:LacI family DNA-binding transcriptional regulator [Candidatus Epulopiscium viviparus]
MEYKKPATMRDIAELAGVSVATVSYVLNYSEKEKISHDTRLRVFDAAKKLNYIPNFNTKSLTKSIQTNQIGIVVNLEDNQSKNYLFELYRKIDLLKTNIKMLGYEVEIISLATLRNNFSHINSYILQGVILLNIDYASIIELSYYIYFPLILLDCNNNDDLFYRVNTDYPILYQQAVELLGDNFFIIIEPDSNLLHINSLEQLATKNRIIINHDTNKLALDPTKNYLVFGEWTSVRLLNILPANQLVGVISCADEVVSNMQVICTDAVTKITRVVKILHNLLTLQIFHDVHDIQVPSFIVKY